MSQLSIGATAPNFTLPDSKGNLVSLQDFLGKKVVLYFYPKDMTPGCTTQACDFRDSFEKFQEQNAVIIGISKDSPKRHANFIEKYTLPFLLLSDEDGTVLEDYGVWQEKKLYGKVSMGIVRSTFVIDEEGKIVDIYEKVKVKEHVTTVLNSLSNV